MNSQKKILIIDDDMDFGDALKKSLIIPQYAACYASNGAMGIQKVHEYNPDLIICNTDLSPMDGYQVYKQLKESLLLKGIPFIFIKQQAAVEDFRYGMNLGADDFLSKPLNISDLVTTIEMRLQKFKIYSSEVVREFNTLFQLSPIGIIVFSEHAVLRANQSIRTFLKLEKHKHTPIKIKDIFEPSSLVKIKSQLKQCSKSNPIVFNELISLKNTWNEDIKMNLFIAELSRYSDFVQFIGFFTPVASVVNDQLANQICNLLKREMMVVTDVLKEKINQLIKLRTIQFNNQNNSFFTKRENQVLCLSMEGLSIKSIAEKLAISTRTVEKYRTNLMEKSGANNIAEVIVFALKNGLVKI